MRLAVVTPIGPGHAADSLRCAESVWQAWDHAHGPFVSVAHPMLDDTAGTLGPSRARNIIMDDADADWLYFLDADDECHERAFEHFGRTLRADPLLVAVFGPIFTQQPNTKRPYTVPENVYPLIWEDMLRIGGKGTVAMGCFVRADVARAVRFEESPGKESFLFCLNVMHGRRWTKIDDPLCIIRRDTPSAGGPFGVGVGFDWRKACAEAVEEWKAVRPTAR